MRFLAKNDNDVSTSVKGTLIVFLTEQVAISVKHYSSLFALEASKALRNLLNV